MLAGSEGTLTTKEEAAMDANLNTLVMKLG